MSSLLFHRSRHNLHLGAHAFLMILMFCFLAPVAWAILSGFKPASEIVRSPLDFDQSTLTLDNYRAMLSDVPILSGFKNTAIVLVVKGGITMFFAPLAAFAFAKLRIWSSSFNVDASNHRLDHPIASRDESTRLDQHLSSSDSSRSN